MSVAIYQNLNDGNPLAEELLRSYEEMSPQLQAAARFVLAHPKDVALLSMREQAAKANVSHSTMVRLAQFIGFERFEELRELYVDSVRQDRRVAHVTSTRRLPSDRHHNVDDSEAVYAAAAQITRLAEEDKAAQLRVAARCLTLARNIICVGADGDYATAHHFAFSLAEHSRSHTSPEIDIEGICIRQARTRDVVLAVSLTSECTATTELLRKAVADGAAVVAIVRDKTCALARLATVCIYMADSLAGMRASSIGAIAAAEVLASMVGDKLEPNTRITLLDFAYERQDVVVAC